MRVRGFGAWGVEFGALLRSTCIFSLRAVAASVQLAVHLLVGVCLFHLRRRLVIAAPQGGAAGLERQHRTGEEAAGGVQPGERHAAAPACGPSDAADASAAPADGDVCSAMMLFFC